MVEMCKKRHKKQQKPREISNIMAVCMSSIVLGELKEGELKPSLDRFY